MDQNKPQKKKLVKRLKNQYRLVILNDDTFEERASWRLTPLNVFVTVGTFILSFAFLLTYIIAFTPLREYIPGYADVNMQRKVRELTDKVDEITKEMDAREKYLHNLQDIVDGHIRRDMDNDKPPTTSQYENIRNLQQLPHSKEDSILRVEIEKSLTSR